MERQSPRKREKRKKHSSNVDTILNISEFEASEGPTQNDEESDLDNFLQRASYIETQGVLESTKDKSNDTPFSKSPPSEKRRKSHHSESIEDIPGTQPLFNTQSEPYYDESSMCNENLTIDKLSQSQHDISVMQTQYILNSDHKRKLKRHRDDNATDSTFSDDVNRKTTFQKHDKHQKHHSDNGVVDITDDVLSTESNSLRKRHKHKKPTDDSATDSTFSNDVNRKTSSQKKHKNCERGGSFQNENATHSDSLIDLSVEDMSQKRHKDRRKSTEFCNMIEISSCDDFDSAFSSATEKPRNKQNKSKVLLPVCGSASKKDKCAKPAVNENLHPLRVDDLTHEEPHGQSSKSFRPSEMLSQSADSGMDVGSNDLNRFLEVVSKKQKSPKKISSHSPPAHKQKTPSKKSEVSKKKNSQKITADGTPRHNKKAAPKKSASKTKPHVYGDEEELDDGEIERFLRDEEEAVLDFTVPPLHKCTTKQPTATEKEKLEQEGIKIRSGKWSKAEDGILRRNWEAFTREYDIRDPHRLLGIGMKHRSSNKISKFLQLKKFHVRLARDLNDRTLHSVYTRARLLFHPCGQNKGKLTLEEEWQLKNLVGRYGHDWAKIAKVMGRNSKTVCASALYRSKPHKTGPWEPEEEEKLIEVMKKVLNVNDLTGIAKGVPWKKVAKKMDRTPAQCSQHWFHTLSKKVDEETDHPWTKTDSINLIHLLYNSGYREASDVDWEEIGSQFECVGPYYARILKKWYKLKTLVPDYENKEFEDIVTFLYHRVLPNWLEEN